MKSLFYVISNECEKSMYDKLIYLKIIIMKKRQIIVLIVAGGALLGLSFFVEFPMSKKWWNINQLCCSTEVENMCFNVEIADDVESRQRWLMFRESLPDDSGMLFVFDNSDFYSFWMKNTLLPLAWIWMDSDMKIVDVILMYPCETEECPSYVPKNKAKYVLEINQKWVEDNRIRTWFDCWLN